MLRIDDELRALHLFESRSHFVGPKCFLELVTERQDGAPDLVLDGEHRLSLGAVGSCSGVSRPGVSLGVQKRRLLRIVVRVDIGGLLHRRHRGRRRSRGVEGAAVADDESAVRAGGDDEPPARPERGAVLSATRHAAVQRERPDRLARLRAPRRGPRARAVPKAHETVRRHRHDHVAVPRDQEAALRLMEAGNLGVRLERAARRPRPPLQVRGEREALEPLVRAERDEGEWGEVRAPREHVDAQQRRLHTRDAHGEVDRGELERARRRREASGRAFDADERAVHHRNEHLAVAAVGTACRPRHGRDAVAHRQVADDAREHLDGEEEEGRVERGGGEHIPGGAEAERRDRLVEEARAVEHHRLGGARGAEDAHHTRLRPERDEPGRRVQRETRLPRGEGSLVRERLPDKVPRAERPVCAAGDGVAPVGEHPNPSDRPDVVVAPQRSLDVRLGRARAFEHGDGRSAVRSVHCRR
mmetsp:Transcript_26632/g.87320  ORF Transcript_26632/g.87320 Transcript_26632/m.87320 type:complete len:472 (-) Transcript_26632:981-2396(-)